MKRILERTLAAIAGLCIAAPAAAWSDHTLAAWPALAAMPEIKAAPAVKAESLASFLAAEARGLAPLLEKEEAWARAHVALYPPRPDALAFKPGGAPAELRLRFVEALRINPNLKLELFVQALPGANVAVKATLPWSEVTTRRRWSTAQESTYLRLREGDPVAALDVVASATDEPDYGMDIGLWQDNGTPYGKRYGFGKQPFGNPALEFASQAPFHMGFFHEAGIVYKAAGYLQRTYPEYRIHLWRTLAAYALQTGHPYWGWRFAGWALHYVEDLTQPYHATVLPGVSVTRLVWISALDLVGIHGPKLRAITLVSNRHLALENYQYHRMRSAFLHHDEEDALIRAAADLSTDAGRETYADGGLRGAISKQANSLADTTEEVLEHSLPAKYVSDPDYVLGETEPKLDLYALLQQSPAPAQAAMTGLVSGLLRNFGAYTRAFVRTLLAQAKAQAEHAGGLPKAAAELSAAAPWKL